MTVRIMSRSFYTHLIAISLFICAALVLYGVKYQVKEVHEKVASTQRELLEERRGMQIAAAEWAYLSRPDRLASLSEKYLSASAPIGAQQVNDVASLPYPQAQFADLHGNEAAPTAAPVQNIAMRSMQQPVRAVPAVQNISLIEE